MKGIDLYSLEKRLHHPDEEVRRKGVESLALYPLEEVKDLLLEALGDSSWRVRKSAVELIGRLEEKKEIVPYLVEGLRAEENAGLRNAAVEALILMGKVVIPFLRPLLDDRDGDVRKFVIDILGEIGDEGVIEDLIKATEDPDENVRIAAIEAMGKIGGKEGVASMIQLLKEGDTTTKFTVLEALSNLSHPIPLEEIYRVLDHKVLKKAALDLLATIGDRSSLPHILEGLNDSSQVNVEAAIRALYRLASRDPEIECETRKRLKGITDNEVIRKVIRALHSDSREIKKGAIFIVGSIGDHSLIPHLLEAVDEEVESMVEEAILSMGSKAGEVLLEAFQEGAGRTRSFICHLLGRLGYKKAEDLLVEHLDDEDGHLRASAAIALGRLGSKKATGHLIDLLNDRYEDVRVAARKALIAVGQKDRCVIGELKRLLSSPYPHLRKNAIILLGEMGGGGAIGELALALKDEEPDVRRSAIRVIGHLGLKDKIEEIVTALTDEVPEVRREAARVLAQFGCKEAEDPLLLCLRDQDIWVRCEIIQGLASIKSIKALPELKGIALEEGGMVAIKAIEALRVIDPEGSIPIFLESLGKDEKEVKKAALEALRGLMKEGLEDYLLPLLDERDWDVRNEAVKTLASFGPPAVPYLEELHEKETDPTVKKTIYKALQSLKVDAESSNFHLTVRGGKERE